MKWRCLLLGHKVVGMYYHDAVKPACLRGCRTNQVWVPRHSR